MAMAISEVASAVKKKVMNLPRRVLGSRNDRLLKHYRKLVPLINAHEGKLREGFDEKFTVRCTAEHVAEIAAEEQAAARQRIRVELSADLRSATETLRAKALPHVKPVEDWWAT